MKYVCSVCGYVYDDAEETTPFAMLPSDWKCPMCGAPRSAFVPDDDSPEKKENTAVKPLLPDDDMERLSPGELSVLCSNLARGCEKQYKDEEATLFREIAGYFASATPTVPDADINMLSGLLESDLESGYPGTMQAAKEARDRGAQRVCIWGEKVTKMLYMLVERYRNEGPAFLDDTEIWVCSVCGFIYIGDNPPGICPVCKVPAWKFEKTEGRRA